MVSTEVWAFIIITDWKKLTQECCDERFSVLLDCSHSFLLQVQNKVSHLKPIENLSASICSICLVLRETSKQCFGKTFKSFGINTFLLKSEIFRKNRVRCPLLEDWLSPDLRVWWWWDSMWWCWMISYTSFPGPQSWRWRSQCSLCWQPSQQSTGSVTPSNYTIWFAWMESGVA